MIDGVLIRYRDFWDVPRIFFAEHDGELYLFDSRFDKTSEDYLESYDVYLMPSFGESDYLGSWAEHPQKAICKVGVVPIDSVRFDPTKRKEIGAEVFDLLAVNAPSANGTAAHAPVPIS